MKVDPICLVLQGPGAQSIESSFKKIIGSVTCRGSIHMVEPYAWDLAVPAASVL